MGDKQKGKGGRAAGAGTGRYRFERSELGFDVRSQRCLSPWRFNKEFRGLAIMMVPRVDLSEQAISILRQLVNSGSRWFTRLRQLGAVSSYHLETGGQVRYEDLRFGDDDLKGADVLRWENRTVTAGAPGRDDTGDWPPDRSGSAGRRCRRSRPARTKPGR